MTAVTKQYLQPMIAASQRFDQAVGQITRIDVTQPVQWMFTKTGVGRASMKKWTGLEARVFMRKDMRVTIHPTKGTVGGLLSETLQNATLDQAGEALEPALQLWQQHASAWWFESAALAR